jgi:dinuclear metal center YbgI/SA1388 family protein
MSIPTIGDMIRKICSEYRVNSIPDSSRAWNGPQIISDLNRPCRLIVSATDASLEVIEKSVKLGADILICHHGLTWTHGRIPLPSSDDIEAARTQLAIDNNLTIIGLHLPMDAHPSLGNNAVLSKAIDADFERNWYSTKGHPSPLFHEFTQSNDNTSWPEIIDLEDGRKSMQIGIISRVKSCSRSEIKSRLEELIGMEQTSSEMIRCFPEDRNLESTLVNTVAICTGAAGGAIIEAKESGADLLISGEGPAHAAILAHESGVGLLLGGHHATETVGPRALVEWLNEESKNNNWSLKATFISSPIGL